MMIWHYRTVVGAGRTTPYSGVSWVRIGVERKEKDDVGWMSRGVFVKQSTPELVHAMCGGRVALADPLSCIFILDLIIMN